VELVDNIVSERQAEPRIILPGENEIHYQRRSVDTFGLKSGSRIRVFLLTIQAVKIPVAGLYALGDHGMVPTLFLREG
jgi:hypothetical protein